MLQVCHFRMMYLKKVFFDLLPKQSFPETCNQASGNLPDFCACLNTHIGNVSRTFILGVLRGGEGGGVKGGSMWDTSKHFGKSYILLKLFLMFM